LTDVKSTQFGKFDVLVLALSTRIIFSFDCFFWFFFWVFDCLALLLLLEGTSPPHPFLLLVSSLPNILLLRSFFFFHKVIFFPVSCFFFRVHLLPGLPRRSVPFSPAHKGLRVGKQVYLHLPTLELLCFGYVPPLWPPPPPPCFIRANRDHSVPTQGCRSLGPILFLSAG